MPVISSSRLTAGSGTVVASPPEPGRWSDWRLGGGDLRDQLVDAAGERVDVRAQSVDLVEEQLGEFGVVVVEAARECLDQPVVLLP